MKNTQLRIPHSAFRALWRLCASAVLTAFILTGCASFNPQTGQKEFDPVKTEQVKAALDPLISGGIRRVLQNNPGHDTEIATYARAVGHIFCEMDLRGDFSVEYLASEIDKLVTPNFGDGFIIDIKNALLALYRINYAERFRAELPPDKWPRQVASLFCSAIDRGLKDAGHPGI